MAKLVENLKKLVVVTGKGGSGKSTLALAFAHRLSREGKKVWLVEMGRRKDKAFSRLPELVGLQSASHKPQKVKLPGANEEILVSILDPAESLSEYVDLKLPVGGFAGLLLNNRVTASFLEVVPGLPDLVTLGKLWHALTTAKDRPDHIVLDAPASGHALALLKAPYNFARITKVGPIHRDATQMTDFFSNPEQVSIIVTTLPEEMSVQESKEVSHALGKDFPRPLIVANRCFPSLPKVEMKDTLPYLAYDYSRRREQREKETLAELKHLDGRIPFFFPDPAAAPLYLKVSESL